MSKMWWRFYRNEWSWQGYYGLSRFGELVWIRPLGEFNEYWIVPFSSNLWFRTRAE